MFWSKITKIPSKPEAIEDREEITDESSLELKGADSICEPESMLLKVEREDEHDSSMEGTYGGATLSQKVGNHSSLCEELVRFTHFLNCFSLVHKYWIVVEWLRERNSRDEPGVLYFLKAADRCLTASEHVEFNLMGEVVGYFEEMLLVGIAMFAAVFKM
ncbi:hypothetical protein QTP88_027896 [Uroleucon formosanum]